ncbi:MAG: Rid family detoxifying hydrolase [Candidatus Methanomethylicia archaeon]
MIKKEVIATNKAPIPVGPYSQAIRAGSFIFVAGQGPIDPRTRQIIGNTIEEQTEVTLNNIKAILEEAGSSMENVIKVTVYLSNIEDFDAMNRVYSKFFRENPPARTTIQAKLWKNILIEIDAIAVIPDK